MSKKLFASLSLTAVIIVACCPIFCAETRAGLREPPDVEIISPREGEAVQGRITIEARVNNPEEVTFIDFYIQEPGAGDRYGWIAFSPPFFWGGGAGAFDTTLFSDGPASVVAFAFVKGRQDAVSEKRVHFLIDNGKPLVKILSPRDGDSIDDTVLLSLDVRDRNAASPGTGIASVFVYRDGDLLRKLTVPPFQVILDSCLLSPGAHMILVVAVDTKGLSNSDSIIIYSGSKRGIPGSAITDPHR